MATQHTPAEQDETLKDKSPYDATREVIHRHLSDINDKITDEDIKNAYTGKPHPETPADPELEKARKKDIERSKQDDKDDDPDDDNRLTYPPLDIIGE